MTVSHPRNELQSMVDAWRRGGGERKPMCLQVKISYADTDAAALEGAFDEWRYSLLESHVETSLRSACVQVSLAVRLNAITPSQHGSWETVGVVVVDRAELLVVPH